MYAQERWACRICSFTAGARPATDSHGRPYTTDASAAIVVCGRPSPEEQKEGERGEFWPQDCAAAIENLMLQALELGYGTVWCGLYPVKDRCDAIREIIGVDSVPMAIVLVGRPDEAPDARGYFDPTRVKEID